MNRSNQTRPGPEPRTGRRLIGFAVAAVLVLAPATAACTGSDDQDPVATASPTGTPTTVAFLEYLARDKKNKDLLALHIDVIVNPDGDSTYFHILTSLNRDKRENDVEKEQVQAERIAAAFVALHRDELKDHGSVRVGGMMGKALVRDKW
ncbi:MULTISPECIES: hypothetical protein [unclassified Streptomyces]|uniref:hypothetical protein n=1 Tax=unclassified Streptomyces TaxID=2593676 RepID=UPI002E296832|nr:hypothetical protein [Streptomyces sp. NBC_01439]